MRKNKEKFRYPSEKTYELGRRSFDRLKTCDPCRVSDPMSEGEILRGRVKRGTVTA